MEIAEVERIEIFKAKAEVREVDTTNDQGYNGYKGKVFKLRNLEYFEVYNHLRSGKLIYAGKFLYGTTKITVKEFLKRFKTYERHRDS